MQSFHKLHHSTPYKNLTYNDSHKAHIIENILQPIGIVFPMHFIELRVLDLLLACIIIGLRGMMRHDYRFVFLIGNHHLLHHKYPNYNFGDYYLDYLLGTVYPNSEEYVYGVIYT